MLGAAIAYNLKKWLNYTEINRKTAVIALPPCIDELKNTLKDLHCWLLAARCFRHHHPHKNDAIFYALVK